MMLLGSSSSGAIITIADYSVYDLSSGGASATYELNLNGIAYDKTNSGGTVTIGNWATPTSVAANYEVYATLVSGVLSVGTTGSWLALSSTRSWSRNRSALSGISIAQITVDIRLIGTTTVLDSATITLTAETP